MSQLIYINQTHEPIEVMLNWETRNKYKILDRDKKQIGLAIEHGKGPKHAIFRSIFGHWRSFRIDIYNNEKQIELKLHFPFHFFLRSMNIENVQNKSIGTLEQKWSFFRKKFELKNKNGLIIARINSPLLKFWTFEVFSHRKKIGTIQKKFSGLFSEVFTDRDEFSIGFASTDINLETKQMILACSLLIDIIYFERKPR